MRFLYIILLSIILSSCQSQQKKESSIHKQEIDEERAAFIRETIISKMKSNGAKAYCNQFGYVSCYKIHKDQCVNDLTPINVECVSYASNQHPNATSESMNKIGDAWGYCVHFKLAIKNNVDSTELRTCLTQNAIDAKLLINDVLKD